MARGFKTGGRKKGSKNKRTLLLEGAARQLLDDAKRILGDETFEGDAHALLMLTYKNKSLPLAVRLDAAKAAIRFEKPAMSTVDARGSIENRQYIISDKPLTAEEWEKKYCRRES
jgi:hypothetical protein